MKNKVFIATSLDGYIADKNGQIDWLHSIPNPEGIDMGYTEFMNSIDALVMGKTTFETILGFDIQWPYEKPVFVLSHTLKSIPNNLANKVEIVSGELSNILQSLKNKGINTLYIDGGKTIQSFLKEDLIDEIIITTIPILLGGGTSLFGECNPLNFKCVNVNHFLGSVSQSHYLRERS